MFFKAGRSFHYRIENIIEDKKGFEYHETITVHFDYPFCIVSLYAFFDICVQLKFTIQEIHYKVLKEGCTPISIIR